MNTAAAQRVVWHTEDAKGAVSALLSDARQGLSSAAAAQRLAEHGPNRLSERRGTPAWKRFLLQFHQALVYILLVSAAVTLALQEYVDSGVIFGVVVLNAIVGFIQESKAAQAIEALSRVMVSEATVIRDGRRQEIAAAELVPGDIVSLESGDRVPADLRLLRVRELQVEEAALTGESLPVQKQVEVLPADTVTNDRNNMAFASTLVTYGQATGLVVETGQHTEIGKISRMISEAEVLATPLTRKIHKFSGVLLYVILGLSAMTFVLGYLRGMPAVEVFLAAVALAVAAIPEGLPAALTVTLAIGVNRMAKRHAIIRKLPAVEALGSTTVICSDKTGTLTCNAMTVTEVWAGGQTYQVSGTGYEPDGKIDGPGADDNAALMACFRAGALCNDAALSFEEGAWSVDGDPTEGALLVSAKKAGFDAATLQREWPRVDGIPFESQHQYMGTLHHSVDQEFAVICIKGSVEALLARCSAVMNAKGEHVHLDPEAIHGQVALMAESGCRVLAFAEHRTRKDRVILTHDDVQNGLVFLGLQGMMDPPRPEAVDAVAVCRRAGILVKMITGDHATTATAIAQQIGITGGGEAGSEKSAPMVLTGQQIGRYSDDELLGVSDATDVFARTTPEQKLRLVRLLQRRGHVVAMTGDGVNDAPALKQADIGVGMGKRGTEVAKEASDMVLTDDNFASIAAAVEEGRGVFANIIKFITWTLPTNVAEALIVLVAVAAGTALPIQPVQILWINMATALCLGMTLAFEPRERDIMRRPPRDPKTPIISAELTGRIVLVGFMLLAGSFGLFRWARQSGMDLATAQTIAANMLVIGETFYLFNCRSLTRSMFGIGVLSNAWLLLGVASMVGLQLLFTYAGFMQLWFGTAPIGWDAWSRILLVSGLIYSTVGLEKWIRLNRKRASGIPAQGTTM